MKITDYVLSEDFKRWDNDKNDYVVMPAGTFVKPIETKYIPSHVLDKFRYWNKHDYIFAYSSYGMFPIPKKIIREK